jgi:organic hydroperoxide reductase OsmC/OhrA
VKSEADIEPTREIIEGAEAQCFMSNSVKAKVTVIPELAAIPVNGPR